MRAAIVRIGNSRAIRIPKVLLEQCRLADDVEIEVRTGALVVRSARAPRHGWDAQFRSMAARGDDALLGGPRVGDSSWDQAEWVW
jgi:antitoxin MazE